MGVSFQFLFNGCLMRFLILVCSFLVCSTVTAKNFTVATVDMKTLFKEYPGTYPAQKKFDDLSREKKQDLDELADALSHLQTELSQPKSTFSKKERSRKEKEFAQETKDYQNEMNHVQVELDDRNQEMTQMLMSRIKDVVADIAQKKGVDLVLDSNDAVAGKYSLDLTGEVLRAFSQLKPNADDLDSDTP